MNVCYNRINGALPERTTTHIQYKRSPKAGEINFLSIFVCYCPCIFYDRIPKESCKKSSRTSVTTLLMVLVGPEEKMGALSSSNKSLRRKIRFYRFFFAIVNGLLVTQDSKISFAKFFDGYSFQHY